MPRVKVYSTSTCPYCRLEKDYLRSRGIEYEDVLLDEQPESIQASIDTCGSLAVPCTHITKDDGTEVQILGFDRQKIDQALGLK
jgi:glutaredoxin